MINIQIFHGNIFVNLVSLWAGFAVVVSSQHNKYCKMGTIMSHNTVMFWVLGESGSVRAANLVDNSEQTVPSETLSVCEMHFW